MAGKQVFTHLLRYVPMEVLVMTCPHWIDSNSHTTSPATQELAKKKPNPKFTSILFEYSAKKGLPAPREVSSGMELLEGNVIQWTLTAECGPREARVQETASCLLCVERLASYWFWFWGV